MNIGQAVIQERYNLAYLIKQAAFVFRTVHYHGWRVFKSFMFYHTHTHTYICNSRATKCHSCSWREWHT